MMRLARWMADYYLCPLGQVLESIVPAGVRHDVGTRDVTFLAAAPDAAARLAELKLSAKQAAIMQHLLANDSPITGKQFSIEIGCTLAPINELRKKGLIVSSVERQRTDRGVQAPDARRARARIESRPGSSPCHDPAPCYPPLSTKRS